MIIITFLPSLLVKVINFVCYQSNLEKENLHLGKISECAQSVTAPHTGRSSTSHRAVLLPGGGGRAAVPCCGDDRPVATKLGHSLGSPGSQTKRTASRTEKLTAVRALPAQNQ